MTGYNTLLRGITLYGQKIISLSNLTLNTDFSEFYLLRARSRYDRL